MTPDYRIFPRPPISTERTMKGTRNFLLGIGVILLIHLAGNTVADSLNSEKSIDIPSQPLVDALNEWAKQTRLQLIVPEIETEVLTPRVQGRLTAWEALNKLLENTGYTFEFINERTAAVSYKPPLLRPSQRPDALAASIAAALRNSSPLVASLERVTVTGSRLKVLRSDIRADGSVDTPAPVTVLTRERIEELGVSSVPDLLRFLTQEPYVREVHSVAYRAQHSEMRGLGVDTTLILINGRRTVPSAASVATNAFDLNTIPLTAIERIEVLSGSASAVYGADAIGGVINIILKSDISLPQIDLQYGAAEGGADERRASLSIGCD